MAACDRRLDPTRVYLEDQPLPHGLVGRSLTLAEAQSIREGAQRRLVALKSLLSLPRGRARTQAWDTFEAEESARRA